MHMCVCMCVHVCVCVCVRVCVCELWVNKGKAITVEGTEQNLIVVTT